MKFQSTSRHVLVTWTDQQTGTRHTTDLYVKPGSEDLIPLTCAAAVLSGDRDTHRVQVQDVADLAQ